MLSILIIIVLNMSMISNNLNFDESFLCSVRLKNKTNKTKLAFAHITFSVHTYKPHSDITANNAPTQL